MKTKHTLSRITLGVALIFLFFISGCANYNGDDTKVALIKKVDPKPTVFSEKESKESKDLKMLKKARKEVLMIKEVYDVAAVKGEKQTVIAYKVKHLNRFHMKKIEKDINKHLEKKFPKEDFLISSDYKIFLEVIELINDKKDPKFSDKEANKKLKEIIKLKKELT